MSVPPLRVCCAVLIKNGRVFAARRGRNARHALQWEFPGGKVEEGESDEQCLHRELKEELKMEVSIIRQMPGVKHIYDTFEIELIPFLCEQINQTITAKEHEETAWFSQDEMNQVSWSAADKVLVARILKEFF